MLPITANRWAVCHILYIWCDIWESLKWFNPNSTQDLLLQGESIQAVSQISIWIRYCNHSIHWLAGYRLDSLRIHWLSFNWVDPWIETGLDLNWWDCRIAKWSEWNSWIQFNFRLPTAFLLTKSQLPMQLLGMRGQGQKPGYAPLPV
jgi:hypothetical protein